MLDDLRALVVFAKTVELGSFKAASSAMGISPSVASYHISQLEQRHGIALLYRSTRKLSLSDEGKRLYEHARVVVDEAENCLDILARDTETPSGKLTLSLPAVLTQSELSEQIAAFSKSYPKVSLSITYTDVRQDLIAEGIDVAIRIGALKDSNLKSRRVGALKRYLVCSPDYYESMEQPSTPADLETWNWVGLGMLPASRTFKHDSGASISTRNHSNIEVNSVEATCQLALLGLGLASPPDFLVKEKIEQGKLIHVLPEWNIDDIDVFAVWPENVRRTSLAALFISELID